MYDVAIIGAGVIGCSIARELSKYNLDIVVLEKEPDVATGTTKANSGIVHAGYDAKPGTLKAKLNVKGNAMFDELSKKLKFPFKRNGSLVLCFDEEDIKKLYDLKKQGLENGVPDIKVLNKEEVKAMEPAIGDRVVAAMYAPTGGIVGPWEMTIALAENAYENGVDFKLSFEVKDIKKVEKGYKVFGQKDEIISKVVINAAGLYGDDINNYVSNHKVEIIPRKGEYFLFDKIAEQYCKNTLFQLPTSLGKGVLVTPTVDGNLLIGPNAANQREKDDLSTTREGLDEVYEKAMLSINSIPMGNVITSFSGLRARTSEYDFIIDGLKDSSDFINVIGIESPGLSSAPAIGVMVGEMVEELLNPTKKENFIEERKGFMKFSELNDQEKESLIKERKDYGRVVCRCEMVTEGEIIDAIRRPLGATNLDGVKRRTRAGAGRCQAGFCTARILQMLSEELNISPTEVTKFGTECKILVGNIKDYL